VLDAAAAAMREGRTQYTDALGLFELRRRISRWYASRFGVSVDAERIVITAGASAALQLLCLALVDPLDEVLMPDPSYPCNRHFVAAAGGVPVLLPTTRAGRFQPTADSVVRAWTPRTRGVMLATPSNPTGTSIDPAEMGRIVAAVRERGGWTIVDEIYLGLSYDDQRAGTALAHGSDVMSVNSFSKYFSMTGWRLGWLVLPPGLVGAVDKLAQNLYICASTLAQHAAVACFEPQALTEYERRRSEFRARRDFLVPALNALGLQVSVVPDGAFYAWADCSAHAADSWDFCADVMRRAHVAITPGRDFGRHGVERYVRLSYANSMSQLNTAVQRLRACL
jgi:aspartate/methionine/tyrosine aminotransferase